VQESTQLLVLLADCWQLVKNVLYGKCKQTSHQKKQQQSECVNWQAHVLIATPYSTLWYHANKVQLLI
jgi:hypothetical protein